MEGRFTKFKAEIFMLLMAIALFAVSAFLYSYTYQPPAETLAATTSLPEYPYQNYAFSFVGFGSLLMLTASLSYLKRSKAACVNIRLQSSAKNRAD